MSSDTPTRHAVVRGQARQIATIRKYLPSNYTADSDGGDVWIHGTDSAGWTMRDYVIPRLASGLYRAEEIVPTVMFDEHLIAEARGLVSEHGENPEYDRALVEFVIRMTPDAR